MAYLGRCIHYQSQIYFLTKRQHQSIQRTSGNCNLVLTKYDLVCLLCATLVSFLVLEIPWGQLCACLPVYGRHPLLCVNVELHND